MPKDISITKDKFLTKIFKKNCYTIKGNLKSKIVLKRKSFYQYKVRRINKNQSKILKDKKFNLIETSLVFFGKYRIRKISNNVQAESLTKKVKLSTELFKFEKSRFFKDKKISKKLAINFKKNWINNFFKGERGSKLYIIKKKGVILGFLLMIIKKDTAFIDLINIKKKYRNKGYAKELINQSFTNNKKIKFLKAGTQQKNISAIKFYKSIGLKLKEKYLVFHLHT